jgi:hypothetical protein
MRAIAAAERSPLVRREILQSVKAGPALAAVPCKDIAG